jgi:hypothetical protein
VFNTIFFYTNISPTEKLNFTLTLHKKTGFQNEKLVEGLCLRFKFMR